ncbi:hypothetical protein ACFY1B_28645 [Streptomyces mirabilis]|nr:hypothetical protein [Streptomyces sp. AK02-04a]MDX3760854.1 hypothetical protein [Streptomyces sp. AK02-04a]
MIDPAAGTMRRTLLDDSHVEFPGVDDRLASRALPYAGRPSDRRPSGVT